MEATDNLLDDTRTVTLILKSDSVRSHLTQPVVLVIRCLSKKIELFVEWNEHFGDSANVRMRVGAEEAETRMWPLSNDHQATFYPGNTVELVTALFKVNQLVLQVSPLNENPVTAVFDPTGLQEAIRPLQETCGWQSWRDR